MTTLTEPAAPAAADRPARWAGLAWVTWRQHRAALAGVAVLLGGLAVLMLGTGLHIRSVFTSLGLNTCHPVTAARCAAPLSLFEQQYDGWATALTALLQAVPMLIGVFTGGPLLARELETGTFRFAWTQGAGRARPAVAKLVLLGSLIAAAAAAFTALFSWWYHPFFEPGTSPLKPVVFNLSGVAFAAWTLAAFAIGAFAGAAIRRAVPAIAAAFAAWAGLALATPLYLRYRIYQAPVVAHLTRHGQHLIPGRAWVVRTWLIWPDGKPLGPAAVYAVDHQRQSAHVPGWLARHQFGQAVAFQPAARFWHFQLIEGGCLLALAVLLGALTIWLIRRRPA
jgi:hypothetical protein